MRIGVDATCWLNRRGYGRFTRALLHATLRLDRKNEYVFFVDGESEEFPIPSEVSLVRIANERPTAMAAGAHHSRSISDMWRVSRALSNPKLDVVFFPSVYSYVPLSSRVPQLVTIHDVIAEMFPRLVFPTLHSRLFWWAKVKAACMQAHLVLTVSEYSRDLLVRQLRIPPARVRIVSEAGDPSFRRTNSDSNGLIRRFGVPEGARILIYLGGFSPHKNLGVLIDSLKQLQKRSDLQDVFLLMIGDFERDVFFSCYQELRRQVDKSGLQDRVIFTGYLADNEVARLYSQCCAVLLPSFCEGFGLPAIEGAACGAPCIVTTCSPLPRLLGDGAIAVAPEDRSGWVNAISLVLTDQTRREQMSSAALLAAQRLSWEDAARQLLATFEEVQR